MVRARVGISYTGRRSIGRSLWKEAGRHDRRPNSALEPTKAARPAEPALYAVVRRHLESFLTHARETYEAPLPAYADGEHAAGLGG